MHISDFPRSLFMILTLLTAIEVNRHLCYYKRMEEQIFRRQSMMFDRFFSRE